MVTTEKIKLLKKISYLSESDCEKVLIFLEALSESQSVSDNEHTQEECHVAYCKNPLYKEIYCKAHYKQKYRAL